MVKTLLMTRMTGGEDTLMTTFTTHDHLVTTLHDITDDPCDDIDNLHDIYCPRDWDKVTKVTKRTTRWLQGQLMTLTDNVVNLVWQLMWLLLTTCDDRSDDQNRTPTTVTTMGDYLWLSMWRPIDDPRNFLTTSDDSMRWYFVWQSRELPVLWAGKDQKINWYHLNLISKIPSIPILQY